MRTQKRTIPVLGLVIMLTGALLAGCTIVGQPVIPVGSTSAPESPALRDRIGIAVGSATIWEPDAAVRQRAIKAIADTGARWLSMDINWNSINGAGPNVFRWADTDRFVREVRAQGLTIVGITAYSPP